MAKIDQLVTKHQIIWLNGVDEKTKNETLDLLVELLLEQQRRQILSLTGSIQHDKVVGDKGG